MKAQPIDPRDIRWEVDQSIYRVTFWQDAGAASDEWRLTDAADVHEVLAWAAARCAPGWAYQVFLEAGAGGELGTYRLRGHDPLRPDGGSD